MPDSQCNNHSSLTVRDLHTLKTNAWVKDEVISTYLKLLTVEAERLSKSFVCFLTEFIMIIFVF